MKNGFSINTGATAIRLSRNSLRRLASAGSFSVPASSASTLPHQSRSIRWISWRLWARATGYTGNSGGCGKRSSRYSMMTLAWYRDSSRSTCVGQHNTHAMAVVIPGVGEKRHRRTLGHDTHFSGFSCEYSRQKQGNCSRRYPVSRLAPVFRSVHVFPVFLLHEVRWPEHDEQEQQHPHTQTLTFQTHRLGGVGQEV